MAAICGFLKISLQIVLFGIQEFDEGVYPETSEAPQEESFGAFLEKKYWKKLLEDC